MYLIKTPCWIRWLYPQLLWKIKTTTPTLYLTFDDGPHPSITPYVLQILKQYNAKATFFCIGENVAKYPAIYQQIIDAGHTVGNHTHNHLSGWYCNNTTYIANIALAAKHIHSPFFRPPYGKIKRKQIRLLRQTNNMPHTIVMWDILTGDFDTILSKEKCAQDTITKAKSGSIIVFHDNEKAYDRMQYALTEVLKIFSKRGFIFQTIPNKKPRMKILGRI